MKATIVKIGNSQGIRIPKVLLDESKLGKYVELKVQGGKIILSPLKSAKKSPFNDEYLLSVPALGRDWNRPEEDEAWAYLQSER